MPVNAQPADEFERRLGETLQDSVDQREDLPGLLQRRFLLGQRFLPALDFSAVFYALLLVPTQDREVLKDIMKRANIGETLQSVSIKSFFDTWLASKKTRSAASTGERYEMREGLF